MPYTAADCERARRDFPSLARTVAGRPIAFLPEPALATQRLSAVGAGRVGARAAQRPVAVARPTGVGDERIAPPLLPEGALRPVPGLSSGRLSALGQLVWTT